MFSTHQKQISKFAKQSPDNTARVALVVMLSIQQQWNQIGKQTLDVKANSVTSKYLFGSKRKGWEYILANKKNLHTTIFNKTIPLADKLLKVASIPGIGLVKAGFVLQLCIGKVGCLDVHNLKRFGLSASAFKLGKVKYPTALGKAELYIKLCEDLGGCKYLWDSWCDLLAEKYPTKYKDGQQVSRLHVEYCML
jgi:hypothetical protein